jgi:hypothetical protein
MKAKRVVAEKVHDRRSADLPINSSVAVVIVADPYSKDGEKIEVLRSLRNDPLAGMISRRYIDEAQFNAGRKWQKLHECSTIGVIQAIDPGKPQVDGGGMRDFLSDRQIDAFKQLAIAYEEIGPELGRLIFDILASELSITEAAHKRGAKTDYQIKVVGSYFRGALEKLSILWGFASKRT